MPEPNAPPGSVSDALGAAGDCPTVRWRDADWKVAWPTAKTVGRLELLIAAAAQAEAGDLEATAPGAVARCEAKLFARAHRVGGEFWGLYLSDPATGGVLTLLSLLREHHPGLAEADALAMIAEVGPDVSAAMALVNPFFDAAVEAAKKLPAGTTAALAKKVPGR